MSDIVETAVREPLDQITDSWSPDAPRGGRAVMNGKFKRGQECPQHEKCLRD